MGCDGGTIPQRKEVVKQKNQEKRERAKITDQAEKWKICALCGTCMSKPIVSSPYGYLMCKECALEYLIARKQDSLSTYDRMGKFDLLAPINSSKDIKDLKLKENPEINAAKDSSDRNEDEQSSFVCPITGLTTNGSYKFVFSWNCGCVVSERAIKEVPNIDACLVCQKPYKPYDLVLINPANRKELGDNQATFVVRKLAADIKKDDSKTGLSQSNIPRSRSKHDTSDVNRGASTSKVAKNKNVSRPNSSNESTGSNQIGDKSSSQKRNKQDRLESEEAHNKKSKS